MVGKYRKALAAAAIVFCLFSSAFAYSGGSGEAADPYKIGTVSDWQQLMSDVVNRDKHFIMIADVNLQGVALTPVGNSTNQFTGVFNGNGHIIRNVYINMPASGYVGLFGYVGTGGQIRSLGVENVNVIGGSDVGGLVGYSNDGSISNCYSTGAVSGFSDVGGLAGSGGSISNCYSTGAVSGFSNVGGLVGSGGNISNCYSTGAVSGSYYVGGLVGYNSSPITACFWDVNTSGWPTSAGGTGKTTAEMKTISTFADAGWNISDVNGSDADWIMLPDGQDYPEIIYFFYRDPSVSVPLLGDGTQQNPYQIASPEDFIALSQYYSAWKKHIILMTDLNFNGFTVRPIGNSIVKFTGSFDGQGFVIRNAVMNLPNKDYVGLFGNVGSGGVITNLGIEDANIIGKQYVGGLSGLNSGVVISNCYSTGSVAAYSASSSSSSSFVGGLTGFNYNGAAISNCHSTVNVNGSRSTIGGLAGYNGGNSSISNCYATGQITLTDPNSFDSYAGGLAGINAFSTIDKCYATGDVFAISASHYNFVNISGLVASSSGGSISNCYSTGNALVVSASSSDDVGAGGLVGLKNNGNVSNCYSAGTVACDSNSDSNYYVGGFAGSDVNGVILGCFWDIEASDCNVSAGGTSKTTAEMKTLSTFTSAGWDFSYTDGNPADWFIQIDEYPILTWQISPADLYTDGKNNFRDFAVFTQYWMRDDCAIYNYYCDWADLDFNGSVDIDDLAELMNYWLEFGVYN